MSLKALVISCLFGLSVANQPWSLMRQLRGDGVVERRVDGHTVLGTVNDISSDRNNLIFGPNQPSKDADLELETANIIGNLQALNEVQGGPPALLPAAAEEEPGFIDSVFGDGAQSRIVDGINSWVVSKARNNPGCVERFVCETYRTGESLNGVPYVAASIANAAISFMVADMFDQSIDIKELTKAARHGRTIGSCHTMKCDFMDGQLRTLENYFEVVENFVTTIYNSVAGSLGK